MTDDILKLSRECGASVEQWMTTTPRPFAVHFELEALAKFVAAIRSDERRSAAASMVADLTDEQREGIFGKYCVCGSTDTRCVCRRDD
jgi:hypothetical protein